MLETARSCASLRSFRQSRRKAAEVEARRCRTLRQFTSTVQMLRQGRAVGCDGNRICGVGMDQVRIWRDLPFSVFDSPILPFLLFE